MTPTRETTQPATVADLLHHLHTLDDLAERAQSKAADLAHLLSRGEPTRGALVVDAARLKEVAALVDLTADRVLGAVDDLDAERVGQGWTLRALAFAVRPRPGRRR